MNIISIIGLALISAALISILRQYRPEFALPVSAAAGAIILLCAVIQSADIITAVNDITQKAGLDSSNIRLLLKALGICYLTQLACDICTDCGETALAQRVELGGKITVAAMSVPLMLRIVGIITELV